MQVYIETYGCSSSRNDSQIMAGLLTRSGFNIVNNIDLADVIIINTCIVKQVTENKIRFRISQIQKTYPKKKLIIAGCMPEAEYEIAREIAPKASLISTNKITEISSAVEKAINDERVELLGKLETEKVCLPKIAPKHIDIVEICSGCNHACAYCITKLAKGSLVSYAPDKIVEQIEKMHKSSCKEFWLTGQDVASYNYKGLRLPQLLEKIIEKVKGRYFIRLGMMNPAEVKPVLNDLIKIYQDDHIFKFLHIPVQSGSDNVLKAMNRSYSANDFKDIISAFRSAMPEVTVWTDIIVGFPNETDEDFSASLSLLKAIKPDFVNISQFGVRPKTKAAGMKQIRTEIKKERSRLISKLADSLSLAANGKWLGWKGPALVDEYNSQKKNYIARNHAYKPIVISAGEIGQFVNVSVSAIEKTCLLS